MHARDEPAFTPAGSTPRSILVIAEADAQVFIFEESVVIEGEVGVLPGKPFIACQTALKLPRTRTLALTMIIRFQRVIKPGEESESQEAARSRGAENAIAAGAHMGRGRCRSGGDMLRLSSMDDDAERNASRCEEAGGRPVSAGRGYAAGFPVAM
jgi:hypothetical protein